MSKRIRSLLDGLIPPLFQARPAGIAPWFYDYFRDLAEPGGRHRYARALAADLALAGFDPQGRTSLDAGSGFGLTVLSLAALGATEALGVEQYEPMLDSAERIRRDHAPPLPARFVRASVDAIPLPAASVDFIYCNEALSHFLHPAAFYAEAARLLRPGGRLMICDGNNGANPRTVAEVHEVWRRFEEGPPADDLHGHRIEVPYRDRRRGMIEEALPGLVPETAEKLAWGTFGLHGPAVARRARALLTEGRLPSGPPPVDRCPVDPVKGDHIENLIHPAEAAADLRRRGFEVRVHAHFGGARNPGLAAANRVLRAFTPLTLSRARSVKIVAVRQAV